MIPDALLLMLPAKAPDQLVTEQERRGAIAAALDSIPERRATILKLRFGLGGNDEHTLDEIGILLGLHKERVRQIEAKALRDLRHQSRSPKLRPHIEG